MMRWQSTRPQFSQEEFNGAYDHSSFNKHFIRLLLVSLLLGIVAVVLILVLIKKPSGMEKTGIAVASGAFTFALSMTIGSRIVDGIMKRKTIHRLRHVQEQEQE